jgi:membrane fusion protein (multidrug efflux system)
MYYFQQDRQAYRGRRQGAPLRRSWRRLALLCLLLCFSKCQYLDGGEATEGDKAAADSTAADSLAVADTTSADSSRAIDAVPVETAPAVIGEISSFLLFSTTMETEASVEIHPEVSGLVEQVFAEEGDKAAAGDTLVLLDSDQARINDQESAMNLRHLEAGFKRTEEMYRRKLISVQAYEDKLFQLEEAGLRRAKTRLALENTAIRAPFSGVITFRQVQVGARVTPGMKLFDLVKLDDMIARVFVPGKYLTAVSTGQRAQVQSDFLEGKTFRGFVKRISPVLDPKSGTFRVTVGLRDRWEYLRPGIFVNVRIVTDTHPNAVLLPKEAVVYDGGDRYVFAVIDSTATKIKLDTGFENSVHVEALSAIEVNTSIIVVGQNGLRDKARVKVINAAAAKEDAALSQG